MIASPASRTPSWTMASSSAESLRPSNQASSTGTTSTRMLKIMMWDPCTVFAFTSMCCQMDCILSGIILIFSPLTQRCVHSCCSHRCKNDHHHCHHSVARSWCVTGDPIKGSFSFGPVTRCPVLLLQNKSSSRANIFITIAGKVTFCDSFTSCLGMPWSTFTIQVQFQMKPSCSCTYGQKSNLLWFIDFLFCWKCVHYVDVKKEILSKKWMCSIPEVLQELALDSDSGLGLSESDDVVNRWICSSDILWCI